MTNAEIKQTFENDLKRFPNSFWAKRTDDFIHIPNSTSSGVLCGKYGALLGNNYAEDYRNELPLCPHCLERVYLLNKIENAVTNAQLAFWQSIVGEFPELKDYDVDDHAPMSYDENCLNLVTNAVLETLKTE